MAAAVAEGAPDADDVGVQPEAEMAPEGREEDGDRRGGWRREVWMATMMTKVADAALWTRTLLQWQDVVDVGSEG